MPIAPSTGAAPPSTLIGPRITLVAGRDARVLGGHPWIYAGEIARSQELGEPGSVARVYDNHGRLLGQAMVNLHSQIAGRMLSRSEQPIDRDFLHRRLQAAVSRFGRTVSGPGASRLVFGEADLLPGLIVDRYADLLVVQFLTAGMERLRAELLDGLVALVSPRAIYERSDSSARRLEGLEPRTGFAVGDGETDVWIDEAGVQFFVQVAEGQKTGFFLDQRENRGIARALAAGRNVLDCFCYAGGFSVSAAVGGARSVLGVDIAEPPLAWARQSADRNGVGDRCVFQAGNAFDQLRALEREGRHFGLVILDPPAFTKGKDTVPAALRGYKEINLRAMKLLESGGILVTCSCSYHLDAAMFLDMLRDAAADADRRFRLLALRTQAPDHPILLAARETQYLKCAVLEAME